MQRVMVVLISFLSTVFAVTACTHGVTAGVKHQTSQPTTDHASFAQAKGATPSQDASAANGEKIFHSKCSVCHTIGGGRKVGPDLKGVTEDHPHDYLVNFILDPDKMFHENDPMAIAMLKEYNGLKMPNERLNPTQVNDVIAYLQTQGSKETAPAAMPTM